MLDPFPIKPPALSVKLTQPLADYLELPTLPQHAHEIFLFFYFYHILYTRISPAISKRLFPTTYTNFPLRTKLNWDVHVVSLVQCLIVNALALYVCFYDEERANMTRVERMHGYTGAIGMVQAAACAYFLWDSIICGYHIDIFGIGFLAHGISALVVFSFGFRPFVHYYGPTFVLYELSSPFLNFHWFFDKLNMTGSKAQLYNGILLLATFFGCRLVWGTYQSIRIFHDIYTIVQQEAVAPLTSTYTAKPIAGIPLDSNEEIMSYAGNKTIPLWLAITYLASNLVLNALNWYWFEKMIAAVRKRFVPAKEKEDTIKVEVKSEKAKGKQKVSVDETEVRRRDPFNDANPQ